MSKSKHLPNSVQLRRYGKAKPASRLEQCLMNIRTPDIQTSDFNIHLKAREYLMLMQAVLAGQPQTNYRDLWQVLAFIHDLITVSERQYLGHEQEI
ncbi:hypothetical protein VA7868_04536 [Vibrio aerogenes CECT 7868]|uniref:Uncharacterized protein n=1 Tax=Vibrio aerogenes CECT 7868 TaxID=1216006 RepID=A0A1M6EWG7_9VIBR|nr:hypothetical protein [Vibrio aerogenes]SHI89837.1 hypothetical protein VA7868_04536 [Vibrio aerogenes CECT 7868]